MPICVEERVLAHKFISWAKKFYRCSFQEKNLNEFSLDCCIIVNSYNEELSQSSSAIISTCGTFSLVWKSEEAFKELFDSTAAFVRNHL